MHYSAPAHPLIYSLLLQKEEFQSSRKLIVETRTHGERLLTTLQKLGELELHPKQYRLISSKIDILEVTHDINLVGIFPVETLDWKIDEKELKNFVFDIQKDMKIKEDLLLHWLTENGYVAKKSDQENTFFRQGDTIMIRLSKGVLFVSFFGSQIEDILFNQKRILEYRLFSRI
jgi:hypothetical protein